jgi:hypothetical protein
VRGERLRERFLRRLVAVPAPVAEVVADVVEVVLPGGVR